MFIYFMDARGKQRKYHFPYHATRRDIFAKKLPPGERLPSKCMFAEHLDLGLSTAGNAYVALLNEGYLEVKARSGSFVSALATPEDGSVAPATTAGSQSADAIAASAPAISRTESAVPHVSLGDPSAGSPFTPFSHIVRDVLLRFPNELPTHPGSQGVLYFRTVISAYLFRYRGIQAESARIVIGSDTEYLYGLVAQFLPRAALYDVEMQSYGKICLIYSAYVRPCEPLSFDTYGVSADGLASSRAALPHVTSYQSFPSSMTINVTKRFEYLCWARERIAFLVEGDCTSEFSFQEKPLETIYAMGFNDSVIYLNTFIKILAPSMRAAYMVLPKHLLESCRECLGFYVCTVSAPGQHMLAKHIGRDYFERCLSQVRRRSRLAKQGSRAFLPEISLQPSQSGLANQSS